jgi:transcriptional regulator with XRE-family HTH domain
MSQEDVRRESGLSVTTIGKIEKGDPDLTVQRATLRRLDIALQWPAGTSESWFAGRGGLVVEGAATAGVAALVDELTPLVAAQLRGGREQSVISVAGLPPDVVRALEQLVTVVRNALDHGG